MCQVFPAPRPACFFLTADRSPEEPDGRCHGGANRFIESAAREGAPLALAYHHDDHGGTFGASEQLALCRGAPRGALLWDPADPDTLPGQSATASSSQGHAAPVLYAAPPRRATSRSRSSPRSGASARLEGHPILGKLPGVEASTGSLGQGLSIGVGHALAGKLDAHSYRVFVMIGDGENDEGQIRKQPSPHPSISWTTSHVSSTTTATQQTGVSTM